MELYLAPLHRFDHGLGEGGLVAEPLLGKQRLDHLAASVADDEGDGVVLDLHEVALTLQLGHDRLAGLFAVETFQGFQERAAFFVGVLNDLSRFDPS